MASTSKTTGHRRFLDRIKYEIWERNLDDVTWFRRVIVKTARIGCLVGKDVWGGQLTLRAMSLVYTTLLSLIPLLALSFSVLKGFGVHWEIESFLITYLAPLGDRADEVALQFIRFIDNTNVTVLGYIGFAFLFYAVISLLQKIEQAFNYVWQVTRQRSLTQRIRDYVALIIIGPTLMFTSTGIWASLLATDVMEGAARIQSLGWFLQALTQVLPVVLVIIAFSFIYVFVPNTNVHWRPAIIGGIVAGVLWNVGGVAFAVFVGNSANYPTIYSSFATAIFFMIWLYVAWMILLIGGSISFYVQNPGSLSQSRRLFALSNRTKEKLALAIAVAVGRRFYTDRPPHTAASLTEELRLPDAVVDFVLAALETEGLLVRAGKDGLAYVPAHAWDSTTINEPVRCMRMHGEHSALNPDDVADPSIDQAWERLESQMVNGAADVMLRDLSLVGLMQPEPETASKDQARESAG